jgi:hypothetical protein
VLSLSRSLDVIRKDGIDVGNNLAQMCSLPSRCFARYALPSEKRYMSR